VNTTLPLIKSKFAKRCLLATAVIAGFLSNGAASAGTTIYNLMSDFSTSQNPNGVWSYNLAGSPITQTISGALGQGWGYLWSWDGSIIMGADISGGAWDIGTGFDWNAGDIMVHAYSFGGDDSITWTSPSAGTIDVSGLTWDGAFFAGRDASWQLTINGTVVADRSTIYGTYRTDTAASFANNLAPGENLGGIPVAAGDVVQWTTHATSTYGHFVGVDMTIALTAVPEPSSCVFGLLGAAVVMAFHRRYRSY